MHLLIQASDVLVSRGGTTTCAKSLHYGCPLLLNAFGGVMPQERLTAKYFLQDDASVTISSPDELRQVLSTWRKNPHEYQRVCKVTERLRYEDDPTAVIRDLVDLAREGAAGGIIAESP
jgi:processive 1,2-diacylglycerol beta-glucosyltransferase